MTHRTFFLSLILQLLTVTAVLANPVSEQSLFLSLRVTGQAIQVETARVKPVACHSIDNQSSDYRYTLLSKTNQSLYTGYFPDPLFIFEDDFSETDNRSGGMRQVAESHKLLKVPYFKDAARIRFERQGKKKNQWHPRGVSVLSQVIAGEVGQ